MIVPSRSSKTPGRLTEDPPSCWMNRLWQSSAFPPYCESDQHMPPPERPSPQKPAPPQRQSMHSSAGKCRPSHVGVTALKFDLRASGLSPRGGIEARSEERRVGKE